MLFELDKYDRKLHKSRPAIPELPYQPATGIEKASLLYWAEHCVECAAPACYQTCDLYQPRIDTRCRRFTFGAFKNKNFPSVRGYGVEISFKKWAKMEAYGNLQLSETRKVFLWEKILGWISPAANIFGKWMARITGTSRWNALANEAMELVVRRMDSKRASASGADTFLLEIYNPMAEPVRMQLSFSPIAAGSDPQNTLVQLSKAFSTTIVCECGYSRHDIETALLERFLDLKAPFVVRMIPESDSEARLVFLSADFVKFAGRIRSAGASAGQIKCVVFDLDNTLWKGVLVEGDEAPVVAEVVRLLRHLDERGILLSVASKNDHEAALRKLKELELSEYFLYPQINWNPKSQSVKKISERLNIGINSIAFVDDNPFELDEVARMHPDVTCVNASKIDTLFSDARFAGSFTQDGRRRRQLYREAETRDAIQESYGSDYVGFLASCAILLEISPVRPEESERIAELVQRTNQLNFSGQKHTREGLQRVLEDYDLNKYVLRCSDRYGSYGTVGFGVVERVRGEIHIRDFMLSCRVQGKHLEGAFFRHLLEHHNPDSAERMWVNFRKTSRNTPAQQVLQSLGFRECEAKENGLLAGMIVGSADMPLCHVVQVKCSFDVQPSMIAPETDSALTAG